MVLRQCTDQRCEDFGELAEFEDDPGAISDSATHSPPRKRKSHSRELKLRENEPAAGAYEVGFDRNGKYVRRVPTGAREMVSRATEAQIAAETAAIEAKIAAEIEDGIKRYKEKFDRGRQSAQTPHEELPEASSISPTTNGTSWLPWSSGKEKSLIRSVTSESKAERDLFNANHNLEVAKKDYQKLNQEAKDLKKQLENAKRRIKELNGHLATACKERTDAILAKEGMEKQHKPALVNLEKYKDAFLSKCKQVENKDNLLEEITIERSKDAHIHTQRVKKLEEALLEMKGKLLSRESEVSNLQAAEFSANKKSDGVILTDEARSAIEDVFLTKLNAWSREHFNIRKKKLPELVAALDQIEQQAPVTRSDGNDTEIGKPQDDGVVIETPNIDDPMEGIETTDMTEAGKIRTEESSAEAPNPHNHETSSQPTGTSEPDLAKFLTALSNVSWDIRGLLESKGVFFARLVEAVVANSLARNIVAKPFEGYTDSKDIESIFARRKQVSRLAGNRFRSDVMKNLLSTTIREKDSGKPLDTETQNRDNYIWSIVTKIDETTAPVAKLSPKYNENCDQVRRIELFRIALACDNLAKDWTKRLFDVDIIDKEWLEKHRSSPDGAAKLFEVGKDRLLENAREDDDEDGSDAGAGPRARRFHLIMGMTGVGFVKVGTDDGSDYTKEEIWTKAKVHLNDKCMIETEKKADAIPGDFPMESSGKV